MHEAEAMKRVHAVRKAHEHCEPGVGVSVAPSPVHSHSLSIKRDGEGLSLNHLHCDEFRSALDPSSRSRRRGREAEALHLRERVPFAIRGKTAEALFCSVTQAAHSAAWRVELDHDFSGCARRCGCSISPLER